MSVSRCQAAPFAAFLATQGGGGCGGAPGGGAARPERQRRMAGQGYFVSRCKGAKAPAENSRSLAIAPPRPLPQSPPQEGRRRGVSRRECLQRIPMIGAAVTTAKTARLTASV